MTEELLENRARALFTPVPLVVTQHSDGSIRTSEWPTCVEFDPHFISHADRSQIKVDAGYVVIELSNGRAQYLISDVSESGKLVGLLTASVLDGVKYALLNESKERAD